MNFMEIHMSIWSIVVEMNGSQGAGRLLHGYVSSHSRGNIRVDLKMKILFSIETLLYRRLAEGEC